MRPDGVSYPGSPYGHRAIPHTATVPESLRPPCHTARPPSRRGRDNPSASGPRMRPGGASYPGSPSGHRAAPPAATVPVSLRPPCQDPYGHRASIPCGRRAGIPTAAVLSSLRPPRRAPRPPCHHPYGRRATPRPPCRALLLRRRSLTRHHISFPTLIVSVALRRVCGCQHRARITRCPRHRDRGAVTSGCFREDARAPRRRVVGGCFPWCQSPVSGAPHPLNFQPRSNRLCYVKDL